MLPPSTRTAAAEDDRIPRACRSALTRLTAPLQARMAIANQGDRLLPARSIGALLWVGSGQPYDRIRRAGRFICKAVLSDNAQHLKLNRTIASNDRSHGGGVGKNLATQLGNSNSHFVVAICVSWRRKERQFSSSWGLPQQPRSSAQFTGRS